MPEALIERAVSESACDHEIESSGDEEYFENHRECRASRNEQHHTDDDRGEAEYDPAAALDRADVHGKSSLPGNSESTGRIGRGWVGEMRGRLTLGVHDELGTAVKCPAWSSDREDSSTLAPPQQPGATVAIVA